MNNLISVKVENVNGILVTTSNRVAEELGVEHKNLLAKIDSYVKQFGGLTFSHEFYIESTFKNRGKNYRNYLITEKGIAQLIGGYNSSVSKAFDLNVAYINEFERMRNHIKSQKLPQTYLEALKELVKVEEERERLLQENTENKPKVEYHDKVLKAEGLMTIFTIGKDLGLSGVKLNKILNDLKIIYKRGKQWYVYSQYANKGYCQYETVLITDEKTIHNLKWTEKGRKFIIEKLKNLDII